MFNKNNFCHVASNNRNEQKAGIFVYKTTDNLETVETSGYFNEKIIDINLHDFIIHLQYDSSDRTKVSQNLLCVTERTLDNVKATFVTSDWEEAMTAFSTAATQAINARVKIDGTSVMTGPLKFSAGSMRGAVGPYLNGVGFFSINAQGLMTSVAHMTQSGLIPQLINQDLGATNYKWRTLYANNVNNGHDIAIPVTSQDDTLALKSEVDLAANSGRMITDQGVWYAKMEAAGTIPPEAEVEGRNYADFTQVDGNNDPIIVIYTYTSGAWTQTETITPPAAYDGYVPITSKIWDIPEQTGQQGGRVMWNHQSKEFTPYPMIISYEDISVTGDSTVAMPVNPSNNQIVNKAYVDNLVVFDLFDTKWRDATTSNPRWALSDGNWKTNANAVTHLTNDLIAANTETETFNNLGIITAINPSGSLIFYRYQEGDSLGDSHPYAWKSANTTLWYTDSDAPQTTDRIWSSSTTLVSSGSVGTTYNDITIVYYQAIDGHRVVDIQYESAVSALYSALGVAWYYVLDTANSQFKLPRVNPDMLKVITKVPVLFDTSVTEASIADGSTIKAIDSAVISGTNALVSASSANAPTKTFADFESGTSYYAGKKYLYFYVG